MCSWKVFHRLVVTLCLFSFLFYVANAVGSEASYLSFEVPGALGTYPMSVNNSMTVTGYYYVSSTVTRGFLRDADGTITTFDVVGGAWTEPESINDQGEITGFYEVYPGGYPKGFLRYADGRIVTFNPPCFGPCYTSQPVSINAFGEIAGSYPYENAGAPAGFTRSREGVFTYINYARSSTDETVVTGINGNGTTVGFYTIGTLGALGFARDAHGYETVFDFEGDGAGGGYGVTVPEGINADGAIAGWYTGCPAPCATGMTTGAFIRPPQGSSTLFNPPGALVTLPRPGLDAGRATGLLGDMASLSAPHRLSINQPGSITGSYVDTAGAQHGFVRNPGGTITSFDPPRGGQTTATSINDRGVITGTYFNPWDIQAAQGFLRIPIP